MLKKLTRGIPSRASSLPFTAFFRCGRERSSIAFVTRIISRILQVCQGISWVAGPRPLINPQPAGWMKRRSSFLRGEAVMGMLLSAARTVSGVIKASAFGSSGHWCPIAGEAEEPASPFQRRKKGLLLRSLPMVVAGPCPGYTLISSPRGKIFRITPCIS